LTLYVLHELVLLVLKLDFENFVNVLIFLYDRLIIWGVIKRKQFTVNSVR
jgi:hypothetical protein